MKKPAEYAVYRGDKFITVGTAKECAEELGIKVSTILYKSRPTYKRRIAKAKGGNTDAMIVIRLEEDEE